MMLTSLYLQFPKGLIKGARCSERYSFASRLLYCDVITLTKYIKRCTVLFAPFLTTRAIQETTTVCFIAS